MKKIIFTSQAPAPIGPYNQAVLVNGILYTSGQIAINPQTNSLVLDTIEAETQQVMQNLKAVLKAASMDFEDVFKVTIFILNMEHFGRINAIYSQYFNEKTAPARETVQVACLPKNVNIEISILASK